ncbi:MAG: DNA cytosine methyltransferase [Fimbriimonadaceae bacterium]|nr:DNA cytosine methyltransferase [Fimbriimonadaceae bacterium]
MPTFLSFFSGIAGLDHGLERAGWTCLGAIERDPHCLATLSHNCPHVSLLAGDIRCFQASDLRQHFQFSQVDLVVGGPPCQAFSTAGNRQGLNDERGNVFLHFLDLAFNLKPRLIVIENVRGLLSSPLSHRPHKERKDRPQTQEEQPGGALKLILSRLDQEGYKTSFGLYDTAWYGVPQHRERFILIANQGQPVELIGRTTESKRTFRQAVEGLAESDSLPLRPKQAQFLPLLGPGQNWRSLPGERQREALGGAFQASGGRVGFYRRLAWDDPSPTLVTSPTMPATLLAHPEELRPLSIGEYKRLQTLPDDWWVSGSLATQYRLVGNAVPVLFSQALGHHLLGQGSSLAPGLSRYRHSHTEAWLTHYQD